MSDSAPRFAPGWPGIPPRWTSSAKTGAGTALNQHSKVWFTVSHGILNEVYFPRVDQACTRDMGFIVTNGRDFFSEEKRHCTFENRPFEPGVPGLYVAGDWVGNEGLLADAAISSAKSAAEAISEDRQSVFPQPASPPIRASAIG